jgi:hypothetical protein
MTEAAWNHLFNVVEVIALAWIGYLTTKNRQMNISNSEKLDTMKDQTDGLTDHLVRLTGEAEHAKGKIEERAEERARVLLSGPLEARVGPDRIHEPKTPV